VLEGYASERLSMCAGGSGKTRLAIEIAAQLTTNFGDGVGYADLSPITNPDVVPVTVARTFGLPDQPGRSPRAPGCW